jgi:urease accessory protein
MRAASRRRTLAAGAALAGLAAAGGAQAHAGTGLAGGFAAGFLHPLTGADHLLAMVSVGLWGAVLGRPLIVALPVIFPAMMAAGAALGMLGAPFPPVEIGVAASVILLGAAILAEFRAPVWLACAMVAAFGLFHGYAHGRELPSAADPAGYSTGFVLCTGMLHICGIALGLIHRYRAGALAMRGLGAAIGALGGVFLVQAVM